MHVTFLFSNEFCILLFHLGQQTLAKQVVYVSQPAAKITVRLNKCEQDKQCQIILYLLIMLK